MKLENKIKRYIKGVRESENIVDRGYYLTKLNECKKEVINLICTNDFLYCLYGANYNKEHGFKMQAYVDYFLKTYNIKAIYTTIEGHNTRIHNIDFNI